jgi:L,D-transpeptidase ErfK/SrfK
MVWALSQARRKRRLASLWCCLGGLAAATALSAIAAVPAEAAEYPLAPGQSVVGEIQHYVVRRGDVLADIARRFDLGYTALAAANPGVDPWVPRPGTRLVIPTQYALPDAPHRGIVLNLAQYRLFYFPPAGDRVLTYPIGIGVIGWNTPFGTTRVVRKEPHPAWYPPPSIRAQHLAEGDPLPAMVPPGPDNPLGEYALRLGWKNFLIHGTNKPDGVGRNVSHGCIHLYPEDIAHLFEITPVAEPVRTVDQPATAGWVGDRLYVEVAPSQKQTEEIDTLQPVTPEPARGVRQIVRAAAGQYADVVDWRAVDEAANARTGMPVAVADRSGAAPQAASDDREAAPPLADQDAEAYDSAPEPLYGRDGESSWRGGSAPPPYSAEAAEPYDGGPDYPYDPAAQNDAAEQSYRRAQEAYERARQSYDEAGGGPVYREAERPFYRDLR